MKTYYCWSKCYDYFAGGSKDKVIELGNTPSEALKNYRIQKSYTYNYEDSFFEVGKIKVRMNFEKEDKPQRWHARSKWEWEKMQKQQTTSQGVPSWLIFDEVELDYLEDIII